MRAALCPTEVELYTQLLHDHPQGQEGEGKGRGNDGEGEEDGAEEEEDLLAQSMEDEVGQLLRSTVQDLEAALEVCCKFISKLGNIFLGNKKI